MQASVEYDEPDANGLQGCPRHPHVPRFNAARGECPACAAEPHRDAKPEKGPGELACEEAARRGLPDAMTIEDRSWSSWKADRRWAEVWMQRADEQYQAGNVKDAAALLNSATRLADEAQKVFKTAASSALERERQAGLDRRARAMKIPGATEVH